MTKNQETSMVQRYCSEVANELETRWQSCWENDGIYTAPNPDDADFDSSKPKFYC
ncbi:hypothetical protein H8D99_00250 [bacterium]|nr:hypothetical protein [bacterium]